MTRDLKKYIADKFNKPIRSQRDIHELKEDIYEVTGLIIGFNTLRRFFGLLKGVEPHRKTLNALSKYVGFETYNKFLSKDKKDLLWDNWNYLNNFLKKDNYIKSDFNWLKKLKSKEFYFLLITRIISHFFTVKSYQNIDILFNCKDLFFENRREVNAKITTSLSNELSHLSNEELEHVYFFLKNPVFRDLALYSWVEMDNAKAYYGKLLNQSKKYIEKDDEILFTILYLLLVDYLNNKSIKFPSELDVPENCHPILLGRLWSMQLICFPKKRVVILTKILSIAKEIDSKNEFFQEIIPVLLLLKDIDAVELIMNDSYEDLMDYVHWDHVSIERYNLMALAFVYINRDNLLSIEQLFEFFKPKDEFHHNNNYQKLFYAIALYQFRKVTSQKKELLDEAEKLYDTYTQKLGFKYFDKDFLITYSD